MRFKIVESHTPDQWYIYARKWWGWHIYAVRSGLDRACRYVSDYRIGNKPDRQGSIIVADLLCPAVALQLKSHHR